MGSRFLILLSVILVAIYASTSLMPVYGIQRVLPQAVHSPISSTHRAVSLDRVWESVALNETGLAVLGILTIAGIVLGLIAFSRFLGGRDRCRN